VLVERYWIAFGEAVDCGFADLIDFMRHTVTIAQTVEELLGHMRVVPEAKTRSSLRRSLFGVPHGRTHSSPA